MMKQKKVGYQISLRCLLSQAFKKFVVLNAFLFAVMDNVSAQDSQSPLRGQHEVSQVIEGVPRFISGDQWQIASQIVRLIGLETPSFSSRCMSGDLAWNCGEQLRIALDSVIKGRSVYCKSNTRDIQGSWLAQCYVGSNDSGINVNRWLVRNGLAASCCDMNLYRKEELFAKLMMLGIWS